MLPKKRRLTSAEVREVIARGVNVRGSIVSLKYLVNKGVFKVSVVAPKSVAKRAVDRNRLRRVLYGVIRELSKENPNLFPQGLLVFFVRSTPSPLTPALRADISAIINKLS
jgi:ribonuclease P protein component